MQTLLHGTASDFTGAPTLQQDEEYWDGAAVGIFFTADAAAAAFYATGDAAADTISPTPTRYRVFSAAVDMTAAEDLTWADIDEIPQLLDESDAPVVILPGTAEELGIYADEILVRDMTAISSWGEVTYYA